MIKISISDEKYRAKYDLSGQRFGRLTVIERAPPPDTVKHKSTSYWRCKCDCGNEVVVRRNNLTQGIAKSCGCYKNDVNRKHKKENTISVSDGVATFSDTQGKTFQVDATDIDKISHLYWSVRRSYPHYVFAFMNGQKISLHRFLLDAQTNDIVDHVNRDTTDNRRANLRICTTQNNTRNKSLPVNNTSGVIGVCRESGGKWRAYITLNDVNYKLYSGDDKDQAIRRRLLAEKVYFGEFAPQQHLFEKYGIEVNSYISASVPIGTGMDQKPEDPRLLFAPN